MSHAVLRGDPTRAQLYLDSILETVLQCTGATDPRDIPLTELILHSMRANRAGVYMINGSTGESFTNEQILKLAIPVSKALVARRLGGNTVLMMLRNHESLAAVYYGVLFSGAIPLMIDPNSTAYEIDYFSTLINPSVVFCEEEHFDNVTKMADSSSCSRPEIVVADTLHLRQFGAGFSDSIECFRLPKVDLDAPIIMLPTSGSTGLAKAALMTHRGLTSQLPALWSDHKTFPRPTELAMLVSTAQWMTHTNVITTCPVYQVTLLMTPLPTIENLLPMIRRHKPTWALLGPAFASKLAAAATAVDLACFRTVLTTGAKPEPEIMKVLREKLSQQVHLCNGYGMTETQGFVSVPGRRAPPSSVGRISNIFQYKLADEAGEPVEAHQNGQLYLRSELAILPGYYKNVEAYEECLAGDGWWKTGDVFRQDGEGYMYFVERQKFWFKYMNHHISPEEMEAVIGGVPGVLACVVCETRAGPAAGVVLGAGGGAGAGVGVGAREVHAAVDATLSDHKRLRGGVVFLPALPRTHSGKLHRARCRALLNEMLGYQQ